jgi:homospermidine synthase
MKDAVLLELAARWEREARSPDCSDGSEAAKVPNAIAQGERQALHACADTLRSLVQMLGEGDRNQPLYIARQSIAERG